MSIVYTKVINVYTEFTSFSFAFWKRPNINQAIKLKFTKILQTMIGFKQVKLF